MVLKAARRDGLIAENPAEFLTGVRGVNGGLTKRPFTREEKGSNLRRAVSAGVSVRRSRRAARIPYLRRLALG